MGHFMFSHDQQWLMKTVKYSVFLSWSLRFNYFADGKFITVPITGFKGDRTVQAIFVWKVRFDAMCFLGIAGFQCHAIQNKNQNLSTD